jgi:hypothetical protein
MHRERAHEWQQKDKADAPRSARRPDDVEGGARRMRAVGRTRQREARDDARWHGGAAGGWFIR